MPHIGVGRGRSAGTECKIVAKTTLPLSYSVSLQKIRWASLLPLLWYSLRCPQKMSHTLHFEAQPPVWNLAQEEHASLSPCLGLFPERPCLPLDFAASHIWTEMSGSRTVILKPKPRGTSTVKEFRVLQPTQLNICKEGPLSYNSSGYVLVVRDDSDSQFDNSTLVTSTKNPSGYNITKKFIKQCYVTFKKSLDCYS